MSGRGRLMTLGAGSQPRAGYRDSADDDRLREMELPAEEFIRRILLHILPDRFVRIRSYGMLAPRDRGRDLALCRKLLGVLSPETLPASEEGESWADLLQRITGVDPTLCRQCQRGHMQLRQTLALSAQRRDRHPAQGRLGWIGRI